MKMNTKLKTLREANGFTQKNIADFLEVDQSFISKAEQGERTFTADMVSKLTSLFGVSLKSLMSDEECCPSTSYAFRASDFTPDDLKAIAAINKIALNAHFMTCLLSEHGKK